jgi:hypothetical protein
MGLIRQYDAILTADDPDEIRVEAPAGCVWIDGSVHEMVATMLSEDGWRHCREVLCVEFQRETKADLWADVADRMACGVRPCRDPECEWCHPSEDDMET